MLKWKEEPAGFTPVIGLQKTGAWPSRDRRYKGERVFLTAINCPKAFTVLTTRFPDASPSVAELSPRGWNRLHGDVVRRNDIGAETASDDERAKICIDLYPVNVLDDHGYIQD
jgi:hypothetical protein